MKHTIKNLKKLQFLSQVFNFITWNKISDQLFILFVMYYIIITFQTVLTIKFHALKVIN